MAATVIPVQDIPEYADAHHSVAPTLVTIYNWIKRGYRGLKLSTRTMKADEGRRGRQQITGVTVGELNKFLAHRYGKAVA